MGQYDVEKGSFKASDDMDARARRLMNKVWWIIAYDCLELDSPMTRNDVVEVVLDANRLTSYSQTFEESETARYVIWLSRFNKTRFSRICKATFDSKYYLGVSYD